MRKIINVVFITWILIASCQQNVELQDQVENQHFDIKEYIKSIGYDQKNIEKMIIWNGKIEEKSFDEYDLQKDLEVFASYGLPNLGVEEKYNIDTLNQENYKLVRYRASDDQQVLKELDVFIDHQNNEVDSFYLMRLHNTFIARQKIRLTLRKDGTYDFTNVRRNLGKRDSSIIQLRFK